MIWIIIALVVAVVVFGTRTKPTAYDKLQSGQSLDENDWTELRLWDSHFWNDFH